MRFFFDNCISPRLARAIRVLVEHESHTISYLKERFPESTQDVSWLQTLATEGDWVVVSGDLMIRQRPQERDIWKSAKLTTFFMAKGYTALPAWEQVRWLIDKWPLIVEQAARVKPGAAFLVPKVGHKLEAVS
jgi:hypothetical protein